MRNRYHKSRFVHFKTLFVYLFLILFLQIFISKTEFKGTVLSYASNITVSDLLQYTNDKRAQAGLSQLVLNEKLNNAALAKGKNMFDEQYWAHTSPSGKDPWGFINGAGYHYLYAGENLARDFADSRGVVEAWMNSPSHRENLLNPRYRDVGFAVVNGKYGNYETTLVVQEFGTLAVGAPTVETNDQKTVPVAQKSVVPSVQKSEPTPLQVENQVQVPNVEVLNQSSEVKQVPVFQLSQVISLSMIALLIILFVLDWIVVSRLKLARLSGHNGAHLLFLMALAITIILLKRGAII